MDAGLELDEQVAREVMGWRLNEIGPEASSELGWVLVDADGANVDGRSGYWATREAAMQRFQPSTGIADAWRVVEHFIRLRWIVNSDGNDRQWHVVLWRIGPDGAAYGTHAATFPLAVCEVALAAVKAVNRP